LALKIGNTFSKHPIWTKGRFNKLKKAYTILYIMLENDFKGLEEVASIVEPLIIVFSITNLVNLEEVEISIGNTLNNPFIIHFASTEGRQGNM
jgi:hypothetical protein